MIGQFIHAKREDPEDMTTDETTSVKRIAVAHGNAPLIASGFSVK